MSIAQIDIKRCITRRCTLFNLPFAHSVRWIKALISLNRLIGVERDSIAICISDVSAAIGRVASFDWNFEGDFITVLRLPIPQYHSLTFGKEDRSEITAILFMGVKMPFKVPPVILYLHPDTVPAAIVIRKNCCEFLFIWVHVMYDDSAHEIHQVHLRIRAIAASVRIPFAGFANEIVIHLGILADKSTICTELGY